ncbi:hypothetical protein ABIA00_004510 [Bradyrhizobium ottawaense]
MNQEIADAANNENGGNGPKNQNGHFLLQLLSVGRGPVGPRMVAYCSVQTLVVFTVYKTKTEAESAERRGYTCPPHGAFD